MALIRRSQAGRPQGVNASATNVRRYREESVPRENPPGLLGAGSGRSTLGSSESRGAATARGAVATSRGHSTMGGAGKRWGQGTCGDELVRLAAIGVPVVLAKATVTIDGRRPPTGVPGSVGSRSESMTACPIQALNRPDRGVVAGQSVVCTVL